MPAAREENDQEVNLVLKKLHLPSPAFVLAGVALFVATTGRAAAVTRSSH